LNVEYPVFRSRKVRHAFSLALDRQRIIQKFLDGDERPSHSILPASISLLDPNISLPFDLDNARQLFDDGLQDLGLDRRDLPMLSMLIQDREPHKAISREISRMCEEAFGISLNLVLVSRKNFLSKMVESHHAILMTDWYSWYNDPQYSLGVLKDDSLRINPTKWTHPELPELLKQAEEQPHKEARNNCLRRAEALMMNEMPIVPLFDYTYRYLKNECLNGVAISMFGTIDFRWANIKRMGART
jgi:oligopeptide transport system substrate-binding protein